VGAQGLSPVVCRLRSFPTSGSGPPTICLLMVAGVISLFLPTSLVHFQQPLPPPLCTSFQFRCLFSFFFAGGKSVCPGGLVYPRGGRVIPVMLGSHLFGASSMGVVAHLFSQCIVTWRSLSQARGSGCQCFIFPWCFISAKSDSSVSARSLIHRAHTACVCVPVAILDLFSPSPCTNYWLRTTRYFPSHRLA
jgi:hypothetical protein